MTQNPDIKPDEAKPNEIENSQPEPPKQASKPSESDDLLIRSLPYLVPYGVFMLFTMVADYLPSWQSALYILKVFAVAVSLWYYRKEYTELRFRPSMAWLVAAVVGVLVIVMWVGIDKYYPQSGKELTDFTEWGKRIFDHPDKLKGAFNPFESDQMLIPPIVAIIFRIIGAVILVPIFEELFIRSWLMRLVIKEDFWQVKVATFTHLAFWAGVGGFALSHTEWLSAMICSAAWNGLLFWKKDVSLCIISHGVANLALAIYVLYSGQWIFW